MSRTIWDTDTVILLIQEWNALYGEPPRTVDWSPAQARLGQEGVARRFHEDGCWPSLTTVHKLFGSWSAGIRAAGLEPRPRGRPKGRAK